MVASLFFGGREATTGNTSAVRRLLFPWGGGGGGEEIRVPLETPAGEAMFSLWSIAERIIFPWCLLTYRRLLAVFTFTCKFSSEELRGFKFKKRATFKNVRRRSALNVFSFNDSRYFMNAVE